MDNVMNVTAIILAGGLGKRIRSVEAEKPKVMIEINNKPFIHTASSIFYYNTTMVVVVRTECVLLYVSTRITECRSC